MQLSPLPVGDLLYVKPMETPSVSPSGLIFIPGTVRLHPDNHAVVTAVGPDVRECAVGDCVVFDLMEAYPILDGARVAIRESAVYGVFEEEPGDMERAEAREASR